MGTSTVSSKKRSKAAKSALAVALAMLLALGGTFATFYGTQTWTNEGARTTPANPGGRVHDDFGDRVEEGAAVSFDKNVYAESFVDRHDKGEYLVARIRLKNYAEINTDANDPGKVAVEDKTQGTYGDVGSYATVTYDATNKFESNLKFGAGATPDFTVNITGGSVGGQYNYIPTFNKAMSGEGATDVDVRGKYPDYSDYPAAVIKGQSAEYTQAAYYDNGEQFQETHTSKKTVEDYRGVTTLAEWKTMTADEQDNWWVYDDTKYEADGTINADGGWFYWSSPLMPDTATGLLLDSLKVTGASDDADLDWYYALNVEGEFITCETDRKNDPDNGNYYWCNEDDGTVKPVTQGVSDLIAFAQNVEGNYRARISQEIQNATILKETSANGAGVYEGAMVDLSAVEGSETKGEEVYVLHKDKKKRRALVITSYLTKKWGDDGTGFDSFDSTGRYDWNGSEAQAWCEDTYYAGLPTELQKMIPEVTVEYIGPLDAMGNDKYTSEEGHVFFMSRGDNNNMSTSVTSAHDYTVANTLLFKDRGQLKATFKGETQSQHYWHRSSRLVTNDSNRYVSATGPDGSVANILPDSCALWGDLSLKTNVGARPMFWINY